MVKCTSCGKEFSNSQGLGSHGRFGCGGGATAIAVKQAEAIIQAIPRPMVKARSQTSPGLRSQVSDLKQIRIADLRREISDLRPQTSDLGQDLALADLEVRVKRAELRHRLGGRLREADGVGGRRLGIALVLIGVVVYFLAGGKFKLPFFGSVDD